MQFKQIYEATEQSIIQTSEMRLQHEMSKTRYSYLPKQLQAELNLAYAQTAANAAAATLSYAQAEHETYNQRLTQQMILNAANAVIVHNLSRKGKKLWTSNDAGSPITVYEAYDEFKDEYAMQGGYDKEKGQVILQDIGRDMLEGIPKDAAKANANIADTQRYESGQETNEEFWKSVNGESEWWEDI